MPQAHGDRLTAVDASFLAQETPNAHMHVGAVTVFAGPAPDYEALAGHIRSRLHLIPRYRQRLPLPPPRTRLPLTPRYRQRLAVPPLETGRPLWVDDPTFTLEYHLRHAALPAPGSDGQLRAMAARIVSQQLDRDRPLWELWLVEGLEEGRFALISKTHHALLDGVAGVDLATVILDLAPEPADVPHVTRGWQPSRPPSEVEMAVRGLREAVKAPLELAARAVGAAR